MFPVDAHDTALAPMRTAWLTATVIPRSLNEPVGLCPSCLSISSGTFAQRATASRCNRGVLPSHCVTTFLSGICGSTNSRNRHTPDAPMSLLSGIVPTEPLASKSARSAAPRSDGNSISRDSSPPHFGQLVRGSSSSSSVPHDSQRNRFLLAVNERPPASAHR